MLKKLDIHIKIIKLLPPYLMLYTHTKIKKNIKTDQRLKCIANTSDKNMGAIILCDLELGMTLAVQSNKEICGKLDSVNFLKYTIKKTIKLWT